MDPMYRIGEALIGDGPELAHIDLLIGDKQGPVGQAFANGLSNLSVGHTPLTSVIRPNLMTKPATLIIPKAMADGAFVLDGSSVKNATIGQSEKGGYAVNLEFKSKVWCPPPWRRAPPGSRCCC